MLFAPYREYRSTVSDENVNWHRWTITRIATGYSSGDNSSSCGMYHHALVIEGVWKGNFALHIADITDQGIRLRESLNHPVPRGPTLVTWQSRINTVRDQDNRPVTYIAQGRTINIMHEQANQLFQLITDECRASTINFAPVTKVPIFLMEFHTCETWVSFLQETILKSSSEPRQKETLTPLTPPKIIQHAWKVLNVPIPRFQRSMWEAMWKSMKEGISRDIERKWKQSCVIC